ncbi:hypothetical protein VWZ88_12505 [Phaeobacter sp. JH20_36]|uniref:hypothetical protein n=1 Tax=Phaeobacter TaxID=302485 RepID=UPI0027450404|nr:hypothetical protein [Phaeobacter inhibens]GLO70347.1 hypothetical protein MACH17_18640 [Phaeobacter inhibens]
MDPVSATLMLSAASAGATGIAGYQQAKGEQEHARINSYIGRTRALQEDTGHREGLDGELGSMRATFGANQQRPNVGTLEVVNELRRVRDSERRVGVGNRNSEAADWSLRGRNAGSAARASLWKGGFKAGGSLFDLHDYRTNRGGG